MTRVIEGEVIPRLVEAYRQAEQATTGRFVGDDRRRLVDASDVEAFTQRLTTANSVAALSYLAQLRRAGVSDVAIYEDILDPVARRLDEQWHGFGDGFTDSSLAVEQMHRVLHELDRELLSDTDLRGLNRRVMVAVVPGEEASCASLMVSAFLHRAGWDVVEAPAVETYDELMDLVRDEWVVATYLCVNCPCRVAGLARGIECLRRSSDNQALGIVLGGVVVRGDPALALRVGADAAAMAGPEVVQRAEEMLGAATGTC